MAGKAVPMVIDSQLKLRQAVVDDVPELVKIENACFQIDRMSPRSFKWMIQKANGQLFVAETQEGLAGYILILYHRGTHLARIYSLAVLPTIRKLGVGQKLLEIAEKAAVERDCIYMRLEVHLKNKGAIALYEKNGYRRFGLLKDYYEDHSDALRYEKRIMYREDTSSLVPIQYYQQTTDFTCGPASLMMAMKALDKSLNLNRSLELELWREATTIYMTSGHGGSSPLGLALAAWRKGFRVEVYVNTQEPLFLDGVRSDEKKSVMALVHEDFIKQIAETDIDLKFEQVSLSQITDALHQGGIPLVLISSYPFNRTKAPHWVVISGVDDTFVYIHDPEVDEEEMRFATDNIYLPVSRQSFDKAFSFGQVNLRTAVIIYSRKDKSPSLLQQIFKMGD